MAASPFARPHGRFGGANRARRVLCIRGYPYVAAEGPTAYAAWWARARRAWSPRSQRVGTVPPGVEEKGMPGRLRIVGLAGMRDARSAGSGLTDMRGRTKHVSARRTDTPTAFQLLAIHESN